MTDKTKMIIPAKPANAAKTANACGAPAARARRGVVAAELTAAELRTAAREIAAADIANGTRGNYERECRKFTDFAAGGNSLANCLRHISPRFRRAARNRRRCNLPLLPCGIIAANADGRT